MANYRLFPMSQGFTVVELLVVLVVMGILLSIVLSSDLGYTARSRDAERASDIGAIAAELEQRYRSQAASSGPSYPSTATSASALAALIDDADIVVSPARLSSNSLVIATSSADQTPTIDQYIYQPLTAAGALCTATPCARFILYYRNETPPQSVATLHSMRQQ